MRRAVREVLKPLVLATESRATPPQNKTHTHTHRDKEELAFRVWGRREGDLNIPERLNLRC